MPPAYNIGTFTIKCKTPTTTTTIITTRITAAATATTATTILIKRISWRPLCFFAHWYWMMLPFVMACHKVIKSYKGVVADFCALVISAICLRMYVFLQIPRFAIIFILLFSPFFLHLFFLLTIIKCLHNFSFQT